MVGERKPECALAIPTPAEEFDRKVTEELERLLRHHQQGKITGAQLRSSITTLWNAASGLITEELTELLRMADREVKLEECVEKRVYVACRATQMMCVQRLANDTVKIEHATWQADTGYWQVKTRFKEFDKAPLPHQAAKDFIDKLQAEKLMPPQWQRT